MRHEKFNGYTSKSGFLMHGGQERIAARTKEYAWMSLGLMVGAVIIIALAL